MKYRHLATLAVGFALDAVLGDPPNWPHPVRLVGKQIEFEERLIDKYLVPEMEAAGNRSRLERLAGAALAADVALITPFASFALIKGCERVHPALAFAVETALCYQLLAARSLRDESLKVHDALQAGDLPAARNAVAMIVGRDTDELDEEGVARAAVETVAENTSDGVVAPMMYMAVGGAPLGMMYKAMNTLDSMVGYKNDRYIDRGRIPAKLDDVVNFVPARVSGALMCAAAALVGQDARGAWRIFKRDRLNHSSPNSAHTEAACAGALGVQLGGANKYFGKVVEKPTIGDAARPVEAADIPRANTLMYGTAVLSLGMAACAGLVRGIVRKR